jgi:hypothetical protein
LAERYFDKFQLINYANTVVRNITQRTKILNNVYDNPIFYYSYDINQNERPDNISNRYYSDQYKSWILYLSNGIIDPYYGWYLDTDTFNDFIRKKYGSLANAKSKITFFRNNWYADPNPVISANVYNNLAPNLVKFYEPVPINDVITASPRQYVRKQIDLKLQTNALSKYSITNNNTFIIDEIVDITFSITEKGTGQVVYFDEETLILQHLNGVVVKENESGTLISRESKLSLAFTNPTLIANNIPAGESVYWEAITYFDYENELNESRKSIQVLKSEYSQQISKQLKNLLAE